MGRWLVGMFGDCIRESHISGHPWIPPMSRHFKFFFILPSPSKELAVERFKPLVFVFMALMILLAGSSAFAADVTFQNANGAVVQGVRCATHTPTADEMERNAQAVQNWLQGSTFYRDKADVVIPDRLPRRGPRRRLRRCARQPDRRPDAGAERTPTTAPASASPWPASTGPTTPSGPPTATAAATSGR